LIFNVKSPVQLGYQFRRDLVDGQGLSAELFQESSGQEPIDGQAAPT
jgi:hypothetical protein